MKLFVILILSMSVMVACGTAEEPAPEPEPVEEVAAEPEEAAMSHPDIMQAISADRRALQQSIEGGDGTAAAEAAMRLAALFDDALPEYEARALEAAVELNRQAATAAAEAATAATANDMEAALAAHGNLQAACSGCHSQFREKAPDGSFQFKAQ